ncbi:amidohydrolase family protein [Thermodesulfobacteriota bacterium]
MKKNDSQGMDRRTFIKSVGLGAAATLGAPAVVAAQSGKKTAQMGSAEKIDIFPHILTKRFKEVLFKKPKNSFYMKADTVRPALWDLDLRFKSMDKFEGYKQVLTLSAPPLEFAFSPKEAVDVARMANDEMAELVNKYPDRFVAGVASLPLNDIDASVRETERAIKDLKLKGIQMFSTVNGIPIDRPQFLGIYEKMAEYDLPIWLHPCGDDSLPDYPDEKHSKYTLSLSFGWPYQTTMAMSRLVYSGIMEKYPNLKVITHHCGAMLPYFMARAQPAMEPGEVMKVSKPPMKYFKRFYGDTVLGKNVPALMCGHAFFGTDHMLFGSDYPFPGGPKFYNAALGGGIKAVGAMPVSGEDKAKIYAKNARRLLRLS